MKGDLPQAALRLLSALPVRMHVASAPAPIRREDDRSEYHRIWHDNNRKRRNAYLAEKMREYRKKKREAA